jgi:hypothetical protein
MFERDIVSNYYNNNVINCYTWFSIKNSLLLNYINKYFIS